MLKKIKSFRYALAGALLLFCAAVQAQTISGNVKDSNGEPIIGATIMEKGTQNGTVTDFDGNFTLKLQKAGDLNISYVGMQSQVVKTAGKSKVMVVLADDNTTLNDVVVVGYGTMKRKDLTGSVSSVTGEKLTDNPVANVAEALQGKLGGVNVITQDGRPGAEASIRVRGGGSITQSNDPLFIVDGIAVSGIDDIPADQIESIDVLKDASSTAIYGARGANGVILVTTKQAKEGKTSVKYNMYYQIKSKPQTQDLQDAYTSVMSKWQYGQAIGDAYGKGVAKYYGMQMSDGTYSYQNTMDVLNHYATTGVHNYLDDVYQAGSMWNHDLSISGGTEKTKYYADVNYTNDNSTMQNSGYSRWNVNLKLTQQIAKTLNLSLDARYTESKTKQNRYFSGSHSNNTLVYPWMFSSIDDPLGDGDPTDFYMGEMYASSQYNPVAVIADNDYTKKQQRVRFNSALTWTPIKGLTAKTELALSRNWSKTQSWYGRETGADKGTSTAQLTQGDGYNVDWTNTVNYDFSNIIKSDDHKLTVLLGNEVLASNSSSSVIKGVGYPAGWGEDMAFGQIQMASERTKSDFTNEVNVPSHTLSFFGRANYNLFGRYMFTFTLRADGSSKFADGNRWGYFPAGAFAWRISDEPWMKSTQSWLDNLKLRLSIGTSGNDGIDAGAFIDKWYSVKSTTDGTYSYAMKGSSSSDVPIKGNPDLTWETTISRNAGIDYSFLNGKFNGSIDFYWNTTKDCLMLVPCQPAYGFTYQYQNVAKTSNKGIEFAFNYNILDKKDLKLSFGVTYNYNVNKVDKVTSANLGVGPTYASTALLPNQCYSIVEGEPVGLIKGYVADGYYTLDDFQLDVYESTGKWVLKEDVKGTAKSSGLYSYKHPYSITTRKDVNADGTTTEVGAFPGMPKYKDVDGNGYIDNNDVAIIGRMPAQHTGGFNFSGRYKSFDFSANFTYQLDGKVYNGNYAKSVFSGISDKALAMSRLATKFDNCWQMYKVSETTGKLVAITELDELASVNANAKYGVLGYTQTNAIVSDDYIESAAYLRFQTFTVGYTLPKNWIKKAGISNARVYFTAGNIFIIKSYSGLDPDISTDSSMSSSYSGFPTPGYDYNAYPRSRTFTFGLNVAF